jgi:hypothetical protein
VHVSEPKASNKYAARVYYIKHSNEIFTHIILMNVPGTERNTQVLFAVFLLLTMIMLPRLINCFLTLSLFKVIIVVWVILLSPKSF